MKKQLYFGILFFGLISCENPGDNEDVVQTPSKDGAIETQISIEHKVGYDLLITTNKIWVKNRIEKTIIRTDTLKSLGNIMVEGDEDENGNIPKVLVPKNYELFITVK